MTDNNETYDMTTHRGRISYLQEVVRPIGRAADKQRTIARLLLIGAVLALIWTVMSMVYPNTVTLWIGCTWIVINILFLVRTVRKFIPLQQKFKEGMELVKLKGIKESKSDKDAR
jgi:amino acid transporter